MTHRKRINVRTLTENTRPCHALGSQLPFIPDLGGDIVGGACVLDDVVNVDSSGGRVALRWPSSEILRFAAVPLSGIQAARG